MLYSVGTQWIYQDLGSTNGSWINGIPVDDSQIRLIRDGDLLQLASFAMRVVKLGNEEGRVNDDTSVLSFHDGKFSGEYTLNKESANFSVGGGGCDIVVDTLPAGEKLLSVSGQSGNLELSVFQSSQPVIVNGMSVAGETALRDRDEIDVAGYRLVVNDPETKRSSEDQFRSASTLRAMNEIIGVESSSTVEPVEEADERPAIEPLFTSTANQEEVSEESPKPATSNIRDWDTGGSSESSRMRNYVFGKAEEESQVEEEGTGSFAYEDLTPTVGAELSASQRFATLAVEDEGSAKNEKIQAIFGVVVVLILIVLALFFFL